MRLTPKKYNSEHLEDVVKLTSRSDKLGNVFHCVEYWHPRHGSSYVTFERLESAFDFINSNFRSGLISKKV